MSVKQSRVANIGRVKATESFYSSGVKRARVPGWALARYPVHELRALRRNLTNMPLFVLHAIDRHEALPQRLEHYAAHRAFVEAQNDYGISVVMSGPLQSDDGETMIGSLFILEAADRSVVEAFVAADPFTHAGVWGEVRIMRFHRRKG